MHRAILGTESDSNVPVSQWRDARSPQAKPAAEMTNSPTPEIQPQSRTIQRFQKSERLLHWAIALPFMICGATGFILLAFYNLRSEGMSRDILSWMHRIAGAGFMVLPALTAWKYRREYRLHLKNITHAITWKPTDLRWLFLMGAAVVCRRVKLPDQHKFNAAEKVNFLTGLCGYPVFIATGLILWLPGANFMAWIVHVGLALLMTPLILGHIYMAVIHRSTRAGLSGMVSGSVDRDWARHHYRTWYLENFEPHGSDCASAETGSRPELSPNEFRLPHLPSASQRERKRGKARIRVVIRIEAPRHFPR